MKRSLTERQTQRENLLWKLKCGLVGRGSKRQTITVILHRIGFFSACSEREDITQKPSPIQLSLKVSCRGEGMLFLKLQYRNPKFLFFYFNHAILGGFSVIELLKNCILVLPALKVCELCYHSLFHFSTKSFFSKNMSLYIQYLCYVQEIKSRN